MGSSANGKAGTLRERITHNQLERERAIAKLEGSEWEDEITETQIIVQPGGVVNVDQTGNHKAVTVTRPDNPPPPPPLSAPQVAKGLAFVMREGNTWPKVATLALLVVLLVVVIAWRVRVGLPPHP